MKKKILITLSIALLSLNSSVCYADNDFDSIEPEKLTNEELVDAYVDLRDTYNILFDLYSTELMNNHSDSSSNIIDNMEEFSDDDIEYIINAAQAELDARKISTASREDKTSFGNWIIKNYVDQFNNPTEDQYITYNELLQGSFSNSATSNSLLCAKLLIDDTINIMLYEYGKLQVTSYSGKDYKMIILDSSGNKTEVIATIQDNGDRIFIPTNYKDTVFNLLKSEGELKIYLEEKENPITSYLFTIPDSSGFDEIYNSITNK